MEAVMTGKTGEFEVRWDGELAGTPEQVWDAITARTAGWLWHIDYEPRVGGRESGLNEDGGTVTAWDPPRHFANRSADGGNTLDYVLTPGSGGTHLAYRHRGVLTENDDVELDACRQHTAFYYHSLGEYVRHFAGRDAAYVTADAPEASADGGSARLRQALGVPAAVAVGDRVRLAPAGLDPAAGVGEGVNGLDGVVDYLTPAFLGVRTPDALYRFYGRDAWGWPVGVAHHLFGEDVDAAAAGAAWQSWLTGLFTSQPSGQGVA
jgi:hypothetical protein